MRRRWACLLALALAVPAAAQDKNRDKDKDKKAAEQKPVAVTADELVKQADERTAAGDLDGAAELLRKAAALPTAGGDVSLRLGRVLEAKGEMDTAIDAYKAAGDKLSGAAKGEALGRMAVLQRIRGMSEAPATAQAAAAADPEGAWPAIAMAHLRASEGKGDEAVALAQKAAAAGGAAASVALGLAQEARGDIPAAEAAYRAALGDAQQKVAASVGLARVLRKTGRAAEAEPLIKAALDAAPGYVNAYKESARVKIALRRAGEAMGDAATAAALAENDAEAKQLVQEVTVAKALEYLATNQPDLAIQDLTKLRDENPALPAARVGLAKAYVAKRQPDQAITELQEAVKLEPANAEAQYQLGIVQHVMKRNAAAAVPALEKAVEAEAGNVDYRTALGAALVEAKQYDRAVAELTKVAESPDYKKADAWLHLGVAHVAAKRYKDAVTALDKALAIAPNTPAAEANLAWAYFGLKDAKNFTVHANKAKALGHNEPTLLSYLKRIEGGEPIK
jgi:tetratricopeptide (TPR) repeat protein